MRATLSRPLFDYMYRILLVTFALMLTLSLYAQDRVILSGVVKDQNDEPLVGAYVIVEQLSTRWAMTDSEGNYSISLPKGKYTIEASFVGYDSHKEDIDINKNSRLDFNLEMMAIKLSEVNVYSRRADDRVARVQLGAERMSLTELAKTPALFGENDLLKSVTLLPGVKAQGDGQSGFQVRGGTAAQNLVLLDNTPVYNPGHVLGIFSVFNDDAIDKAVLYKGLSPAQYGGASSSVFDIVTRKGDMQEYNFGVDIGLLTAKIFAEGPIVRDKLSYLVTARRSYFDVFLKAMPEYRDNIANFYDLNATLNYNVGKSDIISLSFFNGRDRLGLDELFDMKWGNLNGNVNWYHRYGSKLTSNTSLMLSDYSSNNSMDIGGINNVMNGFIRNYGLKHDYLLSTDNHLLVFGLQLDYVDLESGEWIVNGFASQERRQGLDNAIWINDEWTLSDRLALSLGLRLASFSVLGGSPYYSFNSQGDVEEVLYYDKNEIVKNYLSLEPRASINYRINDNHSIKFGYSKTSQNVYNILNSNMMIPITRYTMASNYLKPQVSNQVSLGYMALTKDQKYEFSIEGYYKSIDNVYDYRDGKSFASNIIIESLLLGGKGRAYGAEILAKRNTGRFTGWVGYTLSWAESQIDGINNGQWYTASNDMRHDISVVGMYELSDSWSVSATWVYNTGQALSAPSAQYEMAGQVVYYYAERNGYRAPAYHRLDVSFTHFKQKKNYSREWTIGVYNLYNHYNPYMITFDSDSTSPTGTKATQYSLFGILPSVTYSINF